MSDAFIFYGTHSANASNGLQGSNMLGGYYNNTALAATIFVDAYASVLALGVTDYCCVALRNMTSQAITGTIIYFDVPANTTAITEHASSVEATITVSKAITDTWESVGYVLNDDTDEIMFYQMVAGVAVNYLYVESTHRGAFGTMSSGISIGDTLIFKPLVKCGIQTSASVESTLTRKLSPVKVAFSTPLLASPLAIGTVAAYGWTAVWLCRTLPIISSAQISVDTQVDFDLVVDYTTTTTTTTTAAVTTTTTTTTAAPTTTTTTTAAPTTTTTTTGGI